MDEQVDILLPPNFQPSGEVKTRRQALVDGDWFGTFNLWIVSNNPVPSVVYQQRGPQKAWEPNKLDASGGGHYQAGEKFTDGLREVEEELGKHYTPKDITYLGRKMHVGQDTAGWTNNNIVELYFVEDDTPLKEYVLAKDEVYAIVSCPIAELLKAHQDEAYTFEADGYRQDGTAYRMKVSKNSFPENWDNYHYKIALLADRYFKGEQNLIY
jgi:isopentenyldiphosphate isomerase